MALTLYLIKLLLYSIIPGVLYTFLLYLSTPYKSWDVKVAFKYFKSGIFTVILLLFLYKMFPSLVGVYGETMIGHIFILAFIQAGLFEEFTKFLNYKIARWFINPIDKRNHPLSMMVYSGIVGLGFASVENISYGLYGGLDVLVIRAVTSVILHMTCGFIIGYWISLADNDYKFRTNPTHRLETLSIIDIVVMSRPKLRKISYSVIGILMATFFHGLYDFNIMVISGSDDVYVHNISMTITAIILIFLVYLSKKMANHLVKLSIS